MAARRRRRPILPLPPWPIEPPFPPEPSPEYPPVPLEEEEVRSFPSWPDDYVGVLGDTLDDLFYATGANRSNSSEGFIQCLVANGINPLS